MNNEPIFSGNKNGDFLLVAVKKPSVLNLIQNLLY